MDPGTPPAPVDQGVAPTRPRTQAAWMTASGRAVVIPLVGIVAVVVMVALSMAWPVDGQVMTAAVVGILTLTATLAGYATGAARDRDTDRP